MLVLALALCTQSITLSRKFGQDVCYVTNLGTFLIRQALDLTRQFDILVSKIIF